MCSYSEKFIIKLCHIGIINIIKNFMDSDNTSILKESITLLSTVVWYFVGQSKQYPKTKQFEIEIQTILLEGSFIPRLLSLILDGNTPDSVFVICLHCFSQYPPQINLASTDTKRILSVLSRKLTLTVLLCGSCYG
mgnify:FL=1